MIKPTSDDENNKKAMIKKLAHEQKRDQDGAILYSQKIRKPRQDRWNDITLGQIKALIRNKHLKFEEITAYLFVGVFQLSVNCLSRELQKMGKSRKFLNRKYHSAAAKIRKMYQPKLDQLHRRRLKQRSREKLLTAEEETKEIFDEWEEYSLDYYNFIDNKYRRRAYRRGKRRHG